MSEQTTAHGNGIGPGATIAGYRIEERIGHGGMAVVYRAADDRLRRWVALKVLSPALASDAAFRTRFIRESRAAAAVDHPNVIPVYDAGDADGLLFLAMRYVQGGDVHTLLAQNRWLPAARAWAIISQVADALDAAHAHKLIHRDVKPANMLLDGTGADPATPTGIWYDHVYLADFGISKQALASRLTSTGQIVGTLDYIAPEQIETAAVDGRADQYSLACVAFELLSGRPPFQAEASIALIQAHLAEPVPSLSQLRPEIPAAVDQVLARAMAKSPVQRYPTCALFAADLGRALGVTAAAGLELHPDQHEPHAAQSVPWSWPTPAAFASDQQSLSRWPAQPPAQLPPAAALPGSGRPPGPGQARQGFANATPGPRQPPHGGGGGGERDRSRNTTIAGLVVAGVAMAAGVCALAFAALSGRAGPASPGPSVSAQSAAPANATSPASSAAARQAAAVSRVLGTSKKTHGSLSGAVYNIETYCSRLSPAQISHDITVIRDAQSQRVAEYRAAGNLTTSAIPGGARLKTALVDALAHSKYADGDFLTWALQEQSHCRPQKHSAAYQAAARQSGVASRFKIAFARLWNRVGPRYGQHKVSPSDI